MEGGWIVVRLRPTSAAGATRPPSVRRRRKTSWSRKLAAVALAAIGAWLLLATAVRVVHRGKILPGTSVQGIALGGVDPSAAAARLERLALPATVRLQASDLSHSIGSGDVGERLDREATVARALAAGRRAPGDFLLAPLRLVGAAEDVAPVYTFDRAAVLRSVRRLAKRADEPPSPGRLTANLDAVPPRDGRRVRRRATADALEAAFTARLTSTEAVVAEVRAPALEDVEQVARDARSFVATGGLRLLGAGRPVRVPRKTLARLLSIEAVGRRGVRLGADRERLEQLVDETADERDRPPRDARLEAPAAPLVVDGMGDLAWRPRRADVATNAARAGRTVDRQAAVTALARAIRERRHDVRLPVDAPAPRVTLDAAKRVQHLIGTFTTRFACCQPRVRNIRLIAEAVDGTVVLPGEQFSLNRVAGRRTLARGFVPAPFISDGKIVPSVGGGVSQFSTTIYNAAYFAGLQLDAHQPHSFYIDRYPAGREATLDYESIDLRWTNDTDAPVLVRAAAAPTSVTVTLYGDNGGRRVRADTGGRRAVAGRDFEISVTRTIQYIDGRVVHQPYTTTYDEPPED